MTLVKPVPLTLLVILLGCSSEKQELGARDRALMVASAWSSGVGQPSCGRPPASATTAALLPLTGTQCLSCIGAGYLARRTSQLLAAPVPPPLLLLVPESDTAIACRFVAIERVRASVIAMPDTLFDRHAPSDSLVLVVSGEGTMATFAGRDARDVVMLLEESKARNHSTRTRETE